MLLPTDEFAILASDGLWDVLTSQEAVGIARAELQVCMILLELSSIAQSYLSYGCVSCD